MKASWGMLVLACAVSTTLIFGETLVADNNSDSNKKNQISVPATVANINTPAIYAHYAIELEKDKDYTTSAAAAQAIGHTEYFESAFILLNRVHRELLLVDSAKGFTESQHRFFIIMLGEAQTIIESASRKKHIEKVAHKPESSLVHQKSEMLDALDVILATYIGDHGERGYFQDVLDLITKVKLRASQMPAPLLRAPEPTVGLLERDTELLRTDYQPEDILESRGYLDSLFYRNYDRESALKRVDNIQERLESLVIEQPKAIDVLRTWEERKYLIPKRVTPEVLVLMGLPGTGKDTIAESYVNALYPQDPRALDKHLYRVQIMRTQADQWSELGSGTGYVGSGEFPPLLDFVVKHSGGRYIKAGKEGKYKVIENPKWKGVDLPGKAGPQDAVIFLNEFHDWSYMNKNEFAKEFIEKGIITVNNPNGGLKKLVFPTNIIIASNDGIDLIADRHIDGRPRGKRKTYKELMAAYEGIASDLPLLRSTFMKTQKGMDNSQDRKGTSEEMVSRFENIVFLAPISPEGLQKIAGIHLNSIKKLYTGLNENVGSLELSWTPEVERFIQNYMFEAEEGARPIKTKVKNLIEASLQELIMRGEIVDQGKSSNLNLDIISNKDGTSSLKIEISGEGEKQEIIHHLKKTEEVAYKKPLSEKEIGHVLDLENRINAQVFGVEHISANISKSLLNAKIRANQNENLGDYAGSKAQVFGFFGLSSTGKTEFTKVLGKELTGSKDNLWIVDANQLQTQAKWEETFGFDQAKPGDRSEFQKEFDRRQGKMIVVIDELANVRDKELLKTLYAYFDEPVVGERKMKDVTFIITGNAGEEWYQGVPKFIPETVRHFSMLEIYKQAIKKRGQNEELLLKYFPEALLKRVGMPRVYFFPPLDFDNIRKLSKLKLNQLFDKVYAPNKETHWWDVYFKNQEEAGKILTAVEREGFSLEGQGRSVHNFVEETFAQALNGYLIQNKIPIGAPVEISLNQEAVDLNAQSKTNEVGEHGKGIYLRVRTAQGDGEVFIQGKAYKARPDFSDLAKTFVAYHEAGHELVTKVFLGDAQKSDGITIQPGVTSINGRWVFYAGLAKSELTSKLGKSEAEVLREMAVLFGGEVAETLTSKNFRHAEGKSNDIERATELARAAILDWGLSEKFGRHSKQHGQTYADYVATLSQEKKAIYESELDRMLDEARALAVEAILLNWNVFVKMGKTLAEEGTMSGARVEEVYAEFSKELLTEWGETHDKYIKKAERLAEGQYVRKAKGAVKFLSKAEWTEELEKREKKAKRPTRESRDAEILHKSLLPKKLASIEDQMEERIAQARQAVSAEGLRTEPVDKKNKALSCKSSF